MLEMINDGLDMLEAGKYKAMVMGHQGENFCAGANIAGILQFCENKDWNGLEKTVKIFQDLTQKIRFSNCSKMKIKSRRNMLDGSKDAH